MKRVVVTGMGAVTPIGNNTNDFWQGLIEGKNGIAKIESFDVSAFKHTMAAQVKDFDPTDLLEKMVVRKVDPFTVYALHAAQQAVNDADIMDKVPAEDFGVYFGSGIGGFETFCKEHQALLENGPRKVTPQFVSKMISQHVILLSDSKPTAQILLCQLLVQQELQQLVKHTEQLKMDMLLQLLQAVQKRQFLPSLLQDSVTA